MRHDQPAGAGSDFDDERQLRLRKRRSRFTLRSPAVISVHLDPIGSPSDLIARHPDQFVVSVRGLGAEREGEFGRSLRIVAARSDDRACRDDHPGSGNDAAFNRLLQPDIGVSSAFGSQIAYGRDSRHEGCVCVSGGSRDP